MKIGLDIQLVLVILFIVCFVFSLLINHILLKFAQTLGVRNRQQQQIRWNPEIKPSLGGISFFLIFLFAFIFSVIQSDKGFGSNLTLLGILAASTLAFLMGLADDAFNTQPLLKFLTQLFCAIIIILSGHSINFFSSPALNYALSVVWVVGLMNSINMLDNMDGIATIVSILACGFIVVYNLTIGNLFHYSTLLSLGVLGALCGFLVYNFHPSRMFMGDTGSQFLGLFLAVMGIDLCWNNDGAGSLHIGLVPRVILVALVFMLPLVDTTTVTINRLWRGQSPFVGGKDHTTHHLYFKGVTEKRIAVLFFITGGVGILLAYLLVTRFSLALEYVSLAYVLIIFFALYLNTVIHKK